MTFPEYKGLLTATSLLALAACAPGTSPWTQEAGSVIESAGFGNATMNNTQIQNGDKHYIVGLNDRFSEEVQDVVTFAFDSAVLGPAEVAHRPTQGRIRSARTSRPVIRRVAPRTARCPARPTSTAPSSDRHNPQRTPAKNVVCPTVHLPHARSQFGRYFVVMGVCAGCDVWMRDQSAVWRAFLNTVYGDAALKALPSDPGFEIEGEAFAFLLRHLLQLPVQLAGVKDATISDH